MPREIFIHQDIDKDSVEAVVAASQEGNLLTKAQAKAVDAKVFTAKTLKFSDQKMLSNQLSN